MSEPHHPASPPAEAKAQTITDGSYIATLLQRLVKERLLVDVSLPASTTPYTSTLLQFSPHKGNFLLDALFPQEGATPLSEQSPLRISAKLKGASLSFDTAIQAPVEENGLCLWQVAMPGALSYQQSRSQHRVVVAALKIVVSLNLGEGGVIRGLLFDICTDGIGIRVPRTTGLKRGKAYRCSIEHSDEESVEIEVELTRAVKATGVLPVQLGAQLHNMSSHDMLQWQRFVAEMERRLLRQ